ncbi:MAG: S26 family signal peptidase, partial [Ilumatobacter fluminis]
MTETYDADRADSDDAEPDTLVEPPAPDDGTGLSSGARAFFDWVVVVGVALLVAILVRTFLLAHFVVDGQSMYSTLSPGDRVF